MDAARASGPLKTFLHSQVQDHIPSSPADQTSCQSRRERLRGRLWAAGRGRPRLGAHSAMCVLGPRRMAPPAGRSLLLLGALGALALPGSAAAASRANRTLILSRENSIRNCSCSADVRDCDYSLANLLCSCRTVLPLAAERSSYSGLLTIWFTDAAALGLLLNFTRVRDLTLARCGPRTLPTGYLAVCGLRTLRVRAPQPSAEQSLQLSHTRDCQGWPACTSISFLDTALFNRDSALRSYSVEDVAGPATSFPRLSLWNTLPGAASNQSYVITVIY